MGVWIWVWVIHVMGQDTRMKRLNSSKLNRLRQEFKKEEKKTKKKQGKCKAEIMNKHPVTQVISSKPLIRCDSHGGAKGGGQGGKGI